MYPLESPDVTRKPRQKPRVYFPAGTLEAAQLERHLGDKDVATVIGRDKKTWQRYRKGKNADGTSDPHGNYVHEDVAPRVIELLEVQPVRPLRRVPSGEELDRLAAQVRRLQDALDAFEARLDAIERRPGPDTRSRK